MNDVAPGVFSVQTTTPFESVVESLIHFMSLNINNKLTEWSHVFQCFRYFSKWQISKVSHNWSLGKLKLILFLLKPIFDKM